MTKKSYTTQAIADALDGELIGDGTIAISRVVHPADIIGIEDIALAVDKSLLPLLQKNKARVAIVAKDTTLEPGLVEACIVVERPRLAMAKLTTLFAEDTALPPGVHPTAIIEPGAKLGNNVTIGACTYIAAHAVIGDNSILYPHVFVGAKTTIGRDSLIYAGVKIGANCIIGHHTIIHFNTSIGADGFSFVTPQLGSVEAAKATGTISESATNHELVRIASLGNVVIGDDVEIGANTSIDRGTIAATRIGNGTKIDNQVQIGHNVVIGENCMLCGGVAIAGSVDVGDRVVLGGATCVADHIKIGSDVIAMGMTGIAGNIQPRSLIGGIPAVARDKMIENHFYFGRIKHFMKKIDIFAKRIDALEQKQKND